MSIDKRTLLELATWAAVGASFPTTWLVLNVLEPEYEAASADGICVRRPTVVDRVDNALSVISERGRDPIFLAVLVASTGVGAAFGWPAKRPSSGACPGSIR